MAELPQFTVKLSEAWIKLSVSKGKAASGRADGLGNHKDEKLSAC